MQQTDEPQDLPGVPLAPTFQADEATEREVAALPDEQLIAERDRLREALLGYENGHMQPLLWLVEKNVAFDPASAWLDYGVTAAYEEFMRYSAVVQQLRQRGACQESPLAHLGLSSP